MTTSHGSIEGVPVKALRTTITGGDDSDNQPKLTPFTHVVVVGLATVGKLTHVPKVTGNDGEFLERQQVIQVGSWLTLQREGATLEQYDELQQMVIDHLEGRGDGDTALPFGGTEDIGGGEGPQEVA